MLFRIILNKKIIKKIYLLLTYVVITHLDCTPYYRLAPWKVDREINISGAGQFFRHPFIQQYSKYYHPQSCHRKSPSSYRGATQKAEEIKSRFLQNNYWYFTKSFPPPTRAGTSISTNENSPTPLSLL